MNNEETFYLNFIRINNKLKTNRREYFGESRFFFSYFYIFKHKYIFLSIFEFTSTLILYILYAFTLKLIQFLTDTVL